MKVSVIVASYRPDMRAMKLTLGSLIEQDLDDYEVIISDDGSDNNHYDEIKKFCRDRHFPYVKFVDNKVNKGTVGNYLSALVFCEGDIVKPISPGDCLYCRTTLRDVWTYMTSEHINVCFGRMRAYRRNEYGEVKYIPYHHPYDLNAYREKNNDRIAKNVILYSDNVSGAAMFYDRKHFKELLHRINGRVKYVEDIVQAFDAADGNPARLYDHNVVWYETGEGISTEMHSPFRKQLKRDLKTFYEEILPKYTDNVYSLRRKKLIKWYCRENYYLQILSIICVNPGIGPFILRSLVQYHADNKKKTVKSIGFLSETGFIKNYLQQ